MNRTRNLDWTWNSLVAQELPSARVLREIQCFQDFWRGSRVNKYPICHKRKHKDSVDFNFAVEDSIRELAEER